uniref:Uncharacterized protein n=1 Tax=Rhizophora mucronata TaxID=61149 RepID=A0A2P2NGC4_RHIMU
MITSKQNASRGKSKKPCLPLHLINSAKLL